MDSILVVLEARSVHLETMAVVLMYTVRGTFETHHNHLGGSHILAMVAHVRDILCLHRWLVVSSVSWGPESVDKTVEHMQMAAMEAVNHAHAADDIDWFFPKSTVFASGSL